MKLNVIQSVYDEISSEGESLIETEDTVATVHTHVQNSSGRVVSKRRDMQQYLLRK